MSSLFIKPTSLTLTAPQLSPYLSGYLQSGYKKDTLTYDVVEITGDVIGASISISDYYLPDDGEFHFTVTLAFVAIAQLGIVFGCLDNNLPKKASEIYLREVALKCRRPIKKTTGIEVQLALVGKKPVTNGVYYNGEIDIERKSFVGSASFVLPLT
jgi:hypothetical protein